MKRAIRLLLLLVAPLLLSACLESSPSAAPPGAPNSLVIPTATPPQPPSPTPTSAGQAGRPAWWPSDLELPGSAVLANSRSGAVWITRDPDAAGLAEFLVRQARQSNYAVHLITLSEGSIYDLLLVRNGTTYFINITHGTDVTILTGSRLGTIHLTVAGSAQLDLTLPLREYINTTPGSELAIGSSIPNPACQGCDYYINVHIAPFNGVGTYASQPVGTYIIDAELVPGGVAEQDDYRWAKSCAVHVRDASAGDFICRGLENVNDSTKRVDVTGEWQQPPAP